MTFKKKTVNRYKYICSGVFALLLFGCASHFSHNQVDPVVVKEVTVVYSVAESKYGQFTTTSPNYKDQVKRQLARFMLNLRHRGVQRLESRFLELGVRPGPAYVLEITLVNANGVIHAPGSFSESLGKKSIKDNPSLGGAQCQIDKTGDEAGCVGFVRVTLNGALKRTVDNVIVWNGEFPFGGSIDETDAHLVDSFSESATKRLQLAG